MIHSFSSESRTGCVTMLVGGIAVVLISVAIKFILDFDIQLSDLAPIRSNEKNIALHEEINELEIKIVAKKYKKKVFAKNRAQLTLKLELEKQLESALGEVITLNKLISSEQEVIDLIIKSQETYRLSYIEYCRLSAIGKTYEVIVNRLGEKYYDVKIKNITPTGVSISHQDGATFLVYRTMPAEWQKGFMFTALMAGQVTAAKEGSGSSQRYRNVKKNRSNYSDKDKQQIVRLNHKIASVSMEYTSTQIDAEIAKSRASYQRNLNQILCYAKSSYTYRYYNSNSGTYSSRSYWPRYRTTLSESKFVPEGIKTWEQQFLRFEQDKEKYAFQLDQLKAQLSAIDRSYNSRSLNREYSPR